MKPLEIKMVQMEPSGPSGRPGAPKGRSKYAKMVPRVAQGAPGDPQRGPREPKGTQDEPKGSPREAQSEPKRFKKGEGGCPRGPKHEQIDCSKSFKNMSFYTGKMKFLRSILGSEGFMLAMLVHFGST